MVTELGRVESQGGVLTVSKEVAMTRRGAAKAGGVIGAALVVWVGVEFGTAWIRDDGGDRMVGEVDRVELTARNPQRHAETEVPAEADVASPADEAESSAAAVLEPFVGTVVDRDGGAIAGAIVTIRRLGLETQSAMLRT